MMRRRTMIAAAVSVAVTTTIIAAVEPAATVPETVTLAYRFRKGDRIDMGVAHRALTETTMNGTTQTVETMTDSTKTWRVVSVDDAGRATLEHSVDDVTMTSRTSDRGEIRWASAGDDDPPPGYEAVRPNLGVPLVRMRVAADGRVIDRQELRPCPPAATGDLVVAFPDLSDSARMKRVGPVVAAQLQCRSVQAKD